MAKEIFCPGCKARLRLDVVEGNLTADLVEAAPAEPEPAAPAEPEPEPAAPAGDDDNLLDYVMGDDDDEEED